ncbi:hypothetical protein [uncultured Deefgea sp.]|uniref:hypothetical protein n=1 Tax=uncultured Deefgea sp. TaxID=1304914 RepID=UPI00261E8EF8|nr:hypothetical protein [uncultured Deefgea sp.]
MMSALWLDAASITVPVIGETTTTEAILPNPQLCAELRAALAVFTDLQLEVAV